MPEPSSSIQPLALQFGQRAELWYPPPPQNMQEIKTSALGSVNGKNDGRKRVFTEEPNSDFMAWSSEPLRSQNVMLVSTQRPSTWWNIGECVASGASLR